MRAFCKDLASVNFHQMALVSIETDAGETIVRYFPASSKAECESFARDFLKKKASREAAPNDIAIGDEIDLTEPAPIDPPKPSDADVERAKFADALRSFQRSQRIKALSQELQDQIAQHPEYAEFV